MIRPDARLGGTESEGPWELIVPAHLDDPEARRGIRFRSAVPITVEDLEGLNGVYKTRWPSMENELKALQSRGFGRNRTRSVALTTRRGTDGELARLRAKEASAHASLSSLLEHPATESNVKAVIQAAQTVTASRAAQETTEREASLKYARVQGGSEWLGKWLHLLTHNALALLLWNSEDESVRTMSPTLLFDLLLGRPALTCVQDQSLTMWVERSVIAGDQPRQQALADLFNKQKLRSRGRLVTIRLHETSARMAA